MHPLGAVEEKHPARCQHVKTIIKVSPRENLRPVAPDEGPVMSRFGRLPGGKTADAPGDIQAAARNRRIDSTGLVERATTHRRQVGTGLVALAASHGRAA